MNRILDSFKQNRQVWAWAIIVCMFLIFVGHAPVVPIIMGGLLAVIVTSLRALGAGQRKPWQVKAQ